MNIHTTTNASTCTMSDVEISRPLTEHDIKKAIGLIRDLNKDQDWCLISPDGTLWKGRPIALVSKLMPLTLQELNDLHKQSTPAKPEEKKR